MILYNLADKIVFNILKKIKLWFFRNFNIIRKVLKFGNPNET
jgi:hypothetical protein